MDPLLDHGDRQVPPGAVDLAVNVLAATPPWLKEALARVDLTAYPDQGAALDAIAARHVATPDECLVLHGAAEAFWLLALVLRPRLAACVHPSFTAPEAALRAAGVEVHRVVRDPDDGFGLDPAAVPDDADLVVLGRPDNPTGRLEPVDVVAALCRPGRVVVVDEAFADFLPDAGGLHGARLPGVVCIRSLTKLWGLAGLRVGYLLGDRALVARLAAARQPWPASTPALRAVELVCAAEAERRERAALVSAARAELLASLDAMPVRTWASPANFALLRTPYADLRERLLRHGVAVRKGHTFPGLDRTYVRIAVPTEREPRDRFLEALATELVSAG
ncbi:histidinol-phosphate/aromatic aminotransferase/cobyric acid decarboxylase-like protein [Nocardioides thalensis]|uniref:Aminotransferase n=1 Tax=Nocardioides thalensis TaxID=1914755 RepID=A0A853C2R9_9ACTN|nr:Rv2231c family pyridoxal phosphate-dependent protein CobC [Nocardioides thalensis]NYJ00633.1 histidinol-phosphate/aromatic aminotransferase/cobyric acid decarboxylase-like protein [Nocardioides thalensis]